MSAQEELDRELSKTFGYSSFKSDLQKKAVTAVHQGAHNVFVCMPTGAGKSLCYQLPALLSPGTTLVVSPLIALIEDQVQQLQAKRIKAEALNSKTTSSDRKRILADLQSSQPTIKLLYVTPELIATTGFRAFLDSLYHSGKIALLAIDEAHCVSEWGHDFRPDYLKLGGVRECYRSVPCLALTATATPHVQNDVQKCLRMSPPVSLFKSSCFRSNLFYDVMFKELIKDPLKDLSDFASTSLALEDGRGCGIVYCRTRDGCRMLAGRLSRKGVKSKAYHAGLKPQERSDVQRQWMEGTVPVIVATISFGMGVDKANVRFVAHWTMPKSVEAYYQESGRAGRDGLKALCRMYYSKFDKNELVFLLKKEAAKKSRRSKGHYTAGSGGLVKEATQKSFSVLVRYCEEAQCRHAVIAKFFDDPLPACGRSCDYCVNAAAVKELTRSLHLCQSGKRNGLGTHVANYNKGKLDPTLYGGGKWGYEKCEESDSEGDGSSSDSREGGEDGEGGRKRHKRSRSKSSGLFDDDFFETEFRKRRKHGSPDKEVETPGADCKLKDASNFSQIPRLTLKVREHCLQLLISALEKNAATCIHTLRAPEQAAVDLEYSVFISAKTSQLYKLTVHKKVSEVHQCKSGQAHSSLKDPVCKVDKKTSSFTAASAFVKASELVGKQRKSHSNSKDEQLTSSLNVSDDTQMILPYVSEVSATSELELEDSSSSIGQFTREPSLDHSAMFVKNIIGQSSSKSEDECGMQTMSSFCLASELLPTNKIKDEHHMTLPSMDRGKEPLNPTRRSKKHLANSQKISTFFEKKAPVSPVLEGTKSKGVGGERRKKLADMVVRMLTPYYSNKRISTKELFKKFAKKVSEHFMLKEHTDSAAPPDEGAVGDLLSSYFSRFGSFASDRDTINLERVCRETMTVTKASL